MGDEESGPALTREADESRAPWTRLWSWEALRYRGSGWWLDRLLPHTPLGLVIVAIALPAAWVGTGYAITPDRSAFLATHDVTCQLWFFPLHLVCVRVAGGLWGAGLEPSLDGLGFSAEARRRVRRGALGGWASVGAIAAASYFIYRDISYGLTPNASSGLLPFDDPDLWGFATLGRPVHIMMLGLWTVEWLLFGYLLWLQLWILGSWLGELGRADFTGALDRVLVRDGYREAFTLFGKTTSVSLVFALGNLVFIYLTGELIPREAAPIHGVGDFLREMSDLFSTALLFVLSLIAVIAFAIVLRRALTRTVNAMFAAAGDVALAELARPLELTGAPDADLARLRARLEAQGGLIRAVAFQREVDTVGGRAMIAVVLKALVPLATAALKVKKLFGL